jgi:protease-4
MNGPYNLGPESATPPPVPPPAPPLPAQPPWWYYQRPRGGFFRRLLRGLGILVFILSIMLNIYLIFALSLKFEGVGTSQTVLRPGSDREVVAVYRLNGVVEDEMVEDFSRFTRDILHNGHVKAVVLRVDSPGGAASSSDQIHAMIKDLQTQGGKKVVVSMGGMAASGGYYISAPADEIFAEETTVTGSIGVIAAWVVIKGTLDKIGMEAVIIKSSDAEGWKDTISSFQKPEERHRAAVLAILNSVQKRFEQVVREGRGDRLKTRQITYKMKVGEGEYVQEIERTDTQPLNGEIFMPHQAMELGLIDAIGYEDAAIDRAGELAGLTKPKVVVYKAQRNFLTRLLDERASTSIKLSPQLLDELQTPRLLLMWKVD